MSIKRKLNHVKKPKIAIPMATVAVVVLGIAGYFLLRGQPVNLSDLKAVKPNFYLTFATTKGWWQGQPVDTPADAPKNLSVFMGDKPNDTAPCFVTAKYNSGTVNSTSELESRQQEISKDSPDKYTFSELGTTDTSMNTPEGTKQYKLKQFTVAHDKETAGALFGYLQLADGYIATEAWCKDPSKLSETLVAIESIKLKQ